MQSEDKIRKADDLFYEIFHDFSMFHLINPTNHQEERERFLAFWDEGKAYNPQYEYRAIPSDFAQWKAKLRSIDLHRSGFEGLFETLRKEHLGSPPVRSTFLVSLRSR